MLSTTTIDERLPCHSPSSRFCYPPPGARLDLYAVYHSGRAAPAGIPVSLTPPNPGPNRASQGGHSSVNETLISSLWTKGSRRTLLFHCCFSMHFSLWVTPALEGFDGSLESSGGIPGAGVVTVSMFFARPARLDSVGQPERGEMSHEAECLAMAAHPVVACASSVC